MIPIAIRLQIRESAVERESASQQARAILRARALRSERAALELQLHSRGRGERRRFEVHRAGERCCPRAARADAALDLHRLETARQIREIGEVEYLILGVVQRDAVDR